MLISLVWFLLLYNSSSFLLCLSPISSLWPLQLCFPITNNSALSTCLSLPLRVSVCLSLCLSSSLCLSLSISLSWSIVISSSLLVAPSFLVSLCVSLFPSPSLLVPLSGSLSYLISVSITVISYNYILWVVKLSCHDCKSTTRRFSFRPMPYLIPCRISIDWFARH